MKKMETKIVKTVKAFLAVICPTGEVKAWQDCKTCPFNEYESRTQFAVECSCPVKPNEEG